MKVIYDFGANIGLNIPYYLLKGDVVVAVEANAVLVAGLRRRFATEVESGRLVVVNRAVTTAAAADSERATFYAYRGGKETGHVWSSLVRPVKRSDDFVEVEVELTHPAELFLAHGQPHFVKVDIEHHDAAVLGDILATDQLPPYLSVEAHDPRVLGILLVEERFKGFKLIRGKHVSQDFASHTISSDYGLRRWSFPHHSAGPFGEDVPGPWLSMSSLVQHYGHFGPGWIDIHATTEHLGREVPRPRYPLPSGARDLAALAVRSSARFFPAVRAGIRRRLASQSKRGMNRD